MKKITKNVYTESNRLHQFSFSKYDEDVWENYNGFPVKNESTQWTEDMVWTIVTKSILTDTPMNNTSLNYLGKGLLNNWSIVRKQLEPIRKYLKYFDITLSYNNYGSTMPIFEFTVKEKYENDVRVVYDALINLDIFDILSDEIYRIYQTDLDYLYQAFEDDMDDDDKLSIIESYYSACEEVGYEPMTEDELVDSLSYSVSESEVRELVKNFNKTLTKL